ncbi:Uu.00g138310.m01.CDS01 [Anthostomella pinea]|uniref:Uu.00g138310.m01.CDS01 n=1 Tax=Anthostomella pinea TaxID=933095 RepID=A0AAI8VPR2_9PEZI|nr:Uu.00g138310.m01.CDS01 [Anthostomella pinea]
MRLPTVLTLFAGSVASGYVYERLEKNDTLFLILDLQVGLFNLARDSDATLYRDAIGKNPLEPSPVMAHGELAKVFDVPVVMTTSAETGPNGPLPGEFLDMFPNAPLIQRPGQVNAWDNADFQAAVRAAGKKQIVMAGITTDVCTTFLALSLREAGYSVFVNVEASGTTTELIRDASNDRMKDAGVQILSLFAIMCELMRDWRNTPGAVELFPFLDKYYPAYGMLIRGHRAAKLNGTIGPGENLVA